MEPKNAAQEIIDGKGVAKTQRRSSFSPMRSPMRALRSLSISSQLSNASDTDLISPVSERRRSTLRKLRGSEKAKQGLARHPSKTSSDDCAERDSNSTRPTTPSATGSRSASISGDIVTVIKSGPLQEEKSVLKSKKEYLVLTATTLCKFRSRTAAVENFPQLSVPTSAIEALTPLDSVTSSKEIGTRPESQIPLENVVSIFRDESLRPSFGIEVWYCNPGASFATIELNFAVPEDRDDWLKQIQYAVRQRSKAISDERTPSEVEVDLISILEAKQPGQTSYLDIFPVIPRRPYTRLRSNSNDVKRNWREGSSFYLAFGKNSCLLAQFTRSPSGQKVNPSIAQFGLVTLSKVNARLNDERFDLVFRLPMDKPKRLDLASRHHRGILSRLFEADMYLKPAWPLWTRREIFLVEGEPHQIPLPNGEDYGGFKRTLEAFLESYHTSDVNWRVNWRNVKHPPEFQLLPCSKGKHYSTNQLLAVFRSIRFNDFFKSLSFTGVDFSILSGLYDNEYRLEPIAWLSRTGKRSLTRDEYEVTERSSILFQEVVAMLLCSESIRHADFSDVLPKASMQTEPQESTLYAANRVCEIVPAIVLLLRSLQTRCKSIVLNGNQLGDSDVSELYQTLQSRPDHIKGLGLSRCQLGEMALTTIWEGIHEQRHSLEFLELSKNFGSLEASRVSQSLCEATKLRHLNISYCLKGTLDAPLFRPWTKSPYEDPWLLEKVDLSGWKINFDTISGLLRYMELEQFTCLRQLGLNNCGISGEVATAIFCRIGKGRDIRLYLNSNPLENGSTDWIDLIHGDEAPKRLHLDMIQFSHETNFNRLLKALEVNSTIEFLSMAGTGPPDRVSPKTSELLSKFLENNSTLHFLDLSGYSGKLEDAHLGWGLSGALSGLKQNATLRQLRIRNHDIGDAEDITELGRVIAVNKGLAMFDIQNNKLDHHQLSQLVNALSLNHQIISFPISSADRDYALDKEKRLFRKSLNKGLQKSLSKAEETRLNGMLSWLEGHWDSEVKNAHTALQRNRNNPVNQLLELDLEDVRAWKDEDLPQWLTCRTAHNGKGTSSANISRSSSFAVDTPVSGHERPIGFFEPVLKTYTIEEESTTSDSDPSPYQESPEDESTPVGEESAPSPDPAKTASSEREHILGRVRQGTFTTRMMK